MDRDKRLYVVPPEGHKTFGNVVRPEINKQGVVTMRRSLSICDFPAFFQEIYGTEPFPWQTRLAQNVTETGIWPSVLNLPTGSGKTAVIDIALFHLAIEADWGEARRAPVRILFVVDRRLIVDDANSRAQHLLSQMLRPAGPISRMVADRLQILSEEGLPLVVRRLRGGLPRENDWARTPTQPTILCSTVDQVGSRLLFRGYGVSDRSKSIHAGLMGSDCRILLDEAHLSEPFRQTLKWVARYRGPDWCEEQCVAGPWGVTLLTATMRGGLSPSFNFAEADYANPILSARWHATKPARLIVIEHQELEKPRIDAMSDQVKLGMKSLREQGVENPVVGVVVNRVARARAVFEALRLEHGEDTDVILMIGPARPVDREELSHNLDAIRTGRPRNITQPMIVVATQCLEAGVDIDLDILISDVASLDALRQRFGRLNRGGRPFVAFSSIVATAAEIAPDVRDAVYGEAIPATWAYLEQAAEKPRSEKEAPTVDMGLAAFADLTDRVPIDEKTLSPRQDAPVLLPSHLDLLSQTAPIPWPDPDVAWYLHGVNRQPASVSVIWRADISVDKDVRRLLMLVPPRAEEAIELPVWVVRRWLSTQQKGLESLADVVEMADEETQVKGRHKIFRWKGDDDGSEWIEPSQIRPGDAIVVPAQVGGVDELGWNPQHSGASSDVADRALAKFSEHYFALRIAPGLVASEVEHALSAVLSGQETRGWKNLRDGLLELNIPDDMRDGLRKLDRARRRKVMVYSDLYGVNASGEPRGVVFVAPLGLEDGDKKLGENQDGGGGASSTEDDVAGSLQGFLVTLEKHGEDVSQLAGEYARRAGLPKKIVDDLEIAGYLHDAGKVDPRFQALLASDPLGADPAQILAKSASFGPRISTELAGLPSRWRHEALSVRIAPRHSRFATVSDAELVLWLLGTHHGWGRPFFPHTDGRESELETFPSVLGEAIALNSDPGPQSLSYWYRGLDWAGLFNRLRKRYGYWGLARLEGILRLADHRASEREKAEEGGQI